MDDGSPRPAAWIAAKAALSVAGSLNVGAVTADAPARCLFFLLLFLWTSKEKVGSIRLKLSSRLRAVNAPATAPNPNSYPVVLFATL